MKVCFPRTEPASMGLAACLYTHSQDNTTAITATAVRGMTISQHKGCVGIAPAEAPVQAALLLLHGSVPTAQSQRWVCHASHVSAKFCDELFLRR